MAIKVLFVCLGNICRSPTAHGVFEHLVAQKQLTDFIRVDSAGTAGWHVGKSPDRRSVAAALKRGYDLSCLRARQVAPQDFQHADYILAMDRSNLGDLQAMKPATFEGELKLFLEYAASPGSNEVPDPYYGDGDGFDRVLQLVESAGEGLLQHIIRQHRL